MQVFVGLENGMEGRQLAWALDHPGCYAYGADGPAAVASIAPAFKKYQEWISRHTPDSWLARAEAVDVSLAEVFDCYTIDEAFDVIDGDGYEVNAWFRHDWKPLTREESERGLQVLRFSRADLLPMVQRLPDAVLDRTYPRERWSIRGELKHIANGELWSPRKLLRRSAWHELDHIEHIGKLLRVTE